MRFALRSVLAGTASLVTSIVTPLVFPKIDPQIGYVLLAACCAMYALAAYLWWTGRQTARPQSSNEWVPLYKAIQWIARDSVWAASYAEADDEWAERAQRVLVSALSMGQIGSTGIKKVVGYTNAGLTEIPKEEWQRAELITKNLSFEIPVAEMRLPRYTEQDPGMYVDPRVDRNAMRRLWPRRSLLARWRRNSPVERLDLVSLFEKQDQWYPYALKQHGVK